MLSNSELREILVALPTVSQDLTVNLIMQKLVKLFFITEYNSVAGNNNSGFGELK